ncbi:MAG: hypothetical protein NVS3B3_11390 [Aquirhabdus sp.]
MNNTLLRTLSMLRMIPRYPNTVTATSIKSKLAAAGYEISLRSIQRDLNELSAILPLISNDAKPIGWSWNPHSETINLPALDPQTALTFKLVEAYLPSLLPNTTIHYLKPWFVAATGVLEAKGNGLAVWPEKIRVVSQGQPQFPPYIDAEVQSVIYQGLLLEQCVEVSYSPPDATKAKKYVVHPIAIVVRDKRIYLVCTIRDYGDIRHLLLHRMRSARLLSDAIRKPKKFNIDHHIANGEFSIPFDLEVIQLEAEFYGYAAKNVTESPIAVDQWMEDLDDGWILVKGTVSNTYDLRTWILGFGDEVNVLEPKELRDELGEIAKNMATNYEETEE